ncbi:hypothetical protein N9115_01465 [bacterium]|nr:hypothetical protein [bacterium]
MINLSSLITRPPTPSVRFEWTTKTALPENAKELRHFFSGGGVADYHDTYYFQTSPEEVDRLILGMKLEHDKSWELKPHYHPLEMETWDQPKAFSHYDEEASWLYSLVTDSSRTKVFVRVSCM